MGQWDDFCAVHKVPFEKFILAYKAMLQSAPDVREEPVAWIWHYDNGKRRSLRWESDQRNLVDGDVPESVTPLYAHPAVPVAAVQPSEGDEESEDDLNLKRERHLTIEHGYVCLRDGTGWLLFSRTTNQILSAGVRLDKMPCFRATPVQPSLSEEEIREIAMEHLHQWQLNYHHDDTLVHDCMSAIRSALARRAG